MSAGLVWVDEAVGEPYAAHLQLTVRQFNGKDLEVAAFERKDGRIGLPRAFAKWAMDLEPEYAYGSPIEVPKCPQPWNDAQAKFFADVGNASGDTLAIADTGTGKTVTGCYKIYLRKVTTMIVVDATSLATQWKDRLIEHNGFAPEDIGFVGGGKMDYQKPVVIAMLQTLRGSKKLPPDLLPRFGLAIFDEVHTYGAEKSAKVLGMVPAAERLALTATPDRADTGHVIYMAHVGAVKITAESKSMDMDTHVVTYHNPPPLGDVWPEDITEIWDILEEDPMRLALVAKLVKAGYDRGRHTVLFMKHIDTLYRVQRLCVSMGVPEEAIGFFTGQIYGPKKDGSIGRVATKEDYLQSVLKEAPCIFATYQKMQKGIDESRIDYVVEGMPQSDLRQARGRAKRLRYGKKKPIWVKIRDMAGPDTITRMFWKAINYAKSQNDRITGLQ